MTIATTAFPVPRNKPRRDFRIALPPSDLKLSQDEEWCVVRFNGQWREIRLHDYAQIFSIPGLYERLLYDILKCNSPATIARLLDRELAAAGAEAAKLRVLDLGAGNGMVGEQLSKVGVDFIVGADIIEEAAQATLRDRPGVYADYHVMDMAQMNQDERRQLTGYEFNCFTCVAALGFGDIPIMAFANAFNVIEVGGWVAFNIKSTYLDNSDTSGFATLVRSLESDKTLDVRRTEAYRHRIGTNRQPIEYTAIVGKKRKDISDSLLTA